ncbi:MAG: hypothetical protein ACO1SX_18375 [Actinomycetota bacterium]
MTVNRSSLGKVIAGVGLAGLMLLGAGATPAEAHDRGRGWGSYRGSSRYSPYRYDRGRYSDYRYGGYRYGGGRYGSYRYGASNRGPYGDLDRDGRRNYWDRDKDGDGRRNERDRAPKNPRRR